MIYLLRLTLILFSSFIVANAQSIGMYGSFNGWPADGEADLDLSTVDNVIYTTNFTFTTSGELLFREDDDANIAFWGTNSFPSGIAVSGGGDNFQHAAGTYLITFNRNTLEFSFDGPNTIGLIGEFNGFSAPDLDLTTTDGINYSLSNFNIPTDGNLKFRQNDAWGIQFGGNGVDASFPSGTAMSTGNTTPNIFATAGTYNVSFNRQTLEYNFVDVSTLSIGSFEATKNLDIALYPNPGINQWFISSNEEIVSYKIFDIEGKSIINRKIEPSKGPIIQEISSLNSGVYVIKIYTTIGNYSIIGAKQ